MVEDGVGYAGLDVANVKNRLEVTMITVHAIRIDADKIKPVKPVKIMAPTECPVLAMRLTRQRAGCVPLYTVEDCGNRCGDKCCLTNSEEVVV